MDLDHILKVTLKNVLSALRIDCGGLFLINRDEKSVSLQARTGLPKEAGTGEMDIVFKDEELKIDLIDRKVRLEPKSTFPSFHLRYRSVVGEMIPWVSCYLITFKGQGVGFFGLDIPEGRELDRHEVHLLGSLGNFLGGAIENARLMKTIRMHRQELRRLTEKLFQSQEEERRRIARELHDEAGQSLTAVKLSLDRLEEKHAKGNVHIQTEIEAIRKMVRRTSSEIRRLSYHLHPTLLIDLGLEPALNLYFKETRLHSGLDIEFNMVGFDKRLDPDIETVFYRFTQEALTNVLKHSGAEKFWLSIIKSYPGIIFVAEDDGIGFDTDIVGKDKRSLGLLGMRERASLLGGTFQLRSSPGRGTRIRINIPFGEEGGHE
jgi:signal transduction histidine kinase